MPKLKQSGFSLIELLIVIVIIAILTALLAVSYTTIQRNARDTQRKSDLQAVAGALERFFSDHSVYPTSSAGKIAYQSDCTVDGIGVPTVEWGSGKISCTPPPAVNEITYIRQLPIDPTRTTSDPDQYCYEAIDLDPTIINNIQEYNLYAALEGTGNLTPAVNNPGGCSGEYNYRITSND